MTTKHEEVHLIPYRVYIAVWAALVVLTGVTVSLTLIDMRQVTVLAAMIVATVKGSLVVLYFMHVRYTKPIFLYMFTAVGITYGVFVGLTFLDYWTR
jgi:cytochrome c oxidase subunit 4